MKTILALMGIGSSSVLAWVLLAAPNVSTAQRLGAPPAVIETPYQTEHAWAVREIVADIDEMARYRNNRAAAAPFTESIAPWHPELLTAYAAGQFGANSVKPNENDPSAQYSKLLDLTPEAIVRANLAASAALKRDMRNPRAHEAAAMVLAAFGLREAAGGMADTRWVLNRLTAHLAVAQALRGGQSQPSVDGQIANVVLLALQDRQKTAFAALAALPSDNAALAAWQRALQMRLTQDWRLLAAPATATRLEKLEYFRARRATLRNTRGGQDLTAMREPIAVDFARIAQSHGMGVEDYSDFVLSGLAGEIAEMRYAYKELHQKELPEELPAPLVNVRAGRLLNDGDPQVVPWGAWAEFAQRHIGQSIVKVDYHFRQMQGSPAKADEFKRQLDAHLGHLTMYPVASTGRTKGKNGTEADLSQISKAIDVAVKAPELISFNYWSFIEIGSKYEVVRREMPKKATWFVPPSAQVPYDVAYRANDLLVRLKAADVTALMDEAPFNIGLLARVSPGFKMNKPVMARVRELIEPRIDYDMWAIDSAVLAARDANDRIALRRRGCALAVGQCLDLAAELIATDEAAAVSEYEKAFRDPALDEVTMSNNSGWLVSHYERSGQLVKAMDLAERSAATGAARGMLTHALLLERRSRIAEADQEFSDLADHYPQRKPWLAGFLYRQAVIAKKPAYADRWKAIEQELFPGGLRAMATAMPEQPAHGVFVEEDSDASRRARLQTGDIIVGLDGWKVESLEQYEAIMAIDPQAASHKFTAWRGVLFTVDLQTRHGMTLKTYPLKGWIE